MEEGLEKPIDTGLERLRDESVRRERLAESLHSENKFAAVILKLMAQIKPRLAMRALEIGRLADLEMLAKAEIGTALKIVEPTQRPLANKLREQAEMEEENEAYKAAAVPASASSGRRRSPNDAGSAAEACGAESTSQESGQEGRSYTNLR
ncbi:hypothetical protein PG987_005881 [Apiospora arundinis]